MAFPSQNLQLSTPALGRSSPLADLTAQLAHVGIGVFVFSTHDTDPILVRAPDLVRDVAALRAVGCELSSDPGAA